LISKFRIGQARSTAWCNAATSSSEAEEVRCTVYAMLCSIIFFSYKDI
jgi:hypothetical protein